MGSMAVLEVKAADAIRRAWLHQMNAEGLQWMDLQDSEKNRWLQLGRAAVTAIYPTAAEILNDEEA